MGAAGFVILLGVVLQLEALCCAPVQSGNMWIASTVVRSVCNMVTLQLALPGMQAVATFWPLLLISMGLVILLLTRPETVQPVQSTSRGGQQHAR